MTPQTRLKLIRDHMRFGRKYTAASLYVIYTQIMSCDALITLPMVKFETLRDQLKNTSSIDDGWLVTEKGLYFKREPRCAFVELHNRIVKIWRKLLS